MFQLPVTPQSIGQTLDHGFRLYFVGFRQAAPLALLAGLTVFVPGVAFWILTGGGEPTPELAPVLLLAGGPVLIAVIVLYYVFYLAVLARLGAFARGEALAAGAAVRRGFRKFLPVFAGSILYGIAVALWPLLFIVPAAMLGLDPPLIAVGSLLVFVPSIILGVSLAFFSLRILFEHDGIVASLTNSHRLVWGDWWRTVVVVSVVMIVYMVIYVAVGLLAGVFDSLLTSARFGYGVFSLLGDLVATVVTFPMLSAVFIVLYHDLLLRKGGADLEERVGELTSAPE